jgi:hypothetical protein
MAALNQRVGDYTVMSIHFRKGVYQEKSHGDSPM